jgi:predicted O-methyltransferase YrrM
MNDLESTLSERFGGRREDWFHFTPIYDANVIFELIQRRKPERFLEIGTNRGHITLLLSTLFERMAILTIDFDASAHPELVTTLPELQHGEPLPASCVGELVRAIPSVTQVIGDSRKFASYPVGYKCDMAFIDGSHAYDDVAKDTTIALAFGATCIIWHDATHPYLGVEKFLHEMEGCLPIEWVSGTNCAVCELPR